MSLPGYDAWKTRVPDDYDGPVCGKCGAFLLRDRTSLLVLWFCERCDEPAEEEEEDLDAIR
jgi:hypothetical protein